MRPASAGALLAAALAAACARPSTPPGGQPDQEPPRVVSVFPAPFDTLEDLRAPVVIEFDERLSMRLEGVQDFRDAVLVSPVTGDVRVDRGRRSLEISLAGGWRSGLVYRVTVLPLFRDLFNNQRREPIELVFTTGAPIPPTAVAGFLEDRLTGLPVPAGRVEAVRRLDTIRYLAVSDTGGFFSLRNIPAGVYDVRAWIDQDRDRTMEFQEPQDTAPLPLGYEDTVVVSLGLLPRDTTPARLIRAEPLDSQKVRLHFDDYFATGTVDGQATLFQLPDSVPFSDGRLLHGSALDSIRARERATADSIRAAARDSILAADTLGADTLAADTLAPETPAGDTAGGARALAGGPVPGGGPPRQPLPARELILLLSGPMMPGAPYVVVVSGVTNIRGVPGGGGAARFRAPVADTTPPPPDTPPPDAPPADTTLPDGGPPESTPPDPRRE